MYRVVPEQVAQLKPFFSARPPANAPMLQAFFEHRAPGHAYVNDVRAPTACVVAVHHRFVFFGGEVSPHFHEAALRELRRTQTLQVVAPARGSRLPRRPVPDAEVHRVEFYRRPDPDRARVRAIQRASAALGEVRRIDATLFNRCAWRDEIIHLLGSAREFLMHGIGYAMLVDGQIAAEAYGCLWTRDRVELAAVTHREYRGRGYATAVCAHLIDTCEAVGFETYWSCDADNDASLHLATKLGYDDPRDYRLLRYERASVAAAPVLV
ncbi:MAG: GNAT family N-acetyltransferase [Opitutaceae bacterium]|nr:GNAT family N-acetyltransferase [Opitutaceae bacterium]